MIVGQRPTSQEKIVSVTDNFGLTGIKKMQGTTRNIYDTLPLTAGVPATGTGVFEFFKGCNARTFPRTNMISGNKLEVGETMVIRELTLAVLTFAANNIDVTVLRTLTVAALAQLMRSDLEIEVGGQLVVKPINLTSMLPAWNQYSQNATNEVLIFKTDIVIPPNLEFIFRLRTTSFAALALNELQLTVGGIGSVFAAKNNF